MPEAESVRIPSGGCSVSYSRKRTVCLQLRLVGKRFEEGVAIHSLTCRQINVRRITDKDMPPKHHERFCIPTSQDEKYIQYYKKHEFNRKHVIELLKRYGVSNVWLENHHTPKHENSTDAEAVTLDAPSFQSPAFGFQHIDYMTYRLCYSRSNLRATIHKLATTSVTLPVSFRSGVQFNAARVLH